MWSAEYPACLAASVRDRVSASESYGEMRSSTTAMGDAFGYLLYLWLRGSSDKLTEVVSAAPTLPERLVAGRFFFVDGFEGIRSRSPWQRDAMIGPRRRTTRA